MRSPRSSSWFALVLMLSLAACFGKSAAPPHTALASSLGPLKAAFNADSGKVRAIFLASPTCGECLSGAAKLQARWLGQDTSSNIAVYVVWSPQLGAEEKHVASASGLVQGARAHHFWDQSELAGLAFQGMLKLPAAAWDVWMLFDGNATWHDSAPPTPAWWEHQLGSAPPELHLDPARFASHAEALKMVPGGHR